MRNPNSSAKSKWGNVSDSAQIERLMIRAPNWVGDAVMAVPSIRYLRHAFPNARVTLVCRKVVAGLFESEDFVDEVFVTDVGSLRGLLRDGRRMRRLELDLAVLLPNSFESSLLARIAGARYVTGYSTDGRRLLLTQAVARQPDFNKKHQVEYYIHLVSEISKIWAPRHTPPATDMTPRLKASGSDRESARSLMHQGGIDPDASRLLAICPGATNSRAKRWLPERFAAIADKFASLGFRTVLVGSPGDLEVANHVAALTKSDPLMLAGRTDLPSLKGVLSLANIVVSNDTGTAHMSAALGIPTAVVFGPTEHFSTKPASQLCEVVRHDVECSPCMLRDCPIDHRCMTAVTVDEVFQTAARLAGVSI
ncbi:MAG TPA: lipopolysaccharide heptosyltransferase II [Blastocatellia bacterium]|nr:lipopolysaccharide heptosyltransferase II [Blastocatellia bacterium]